MTNLLDIATVICLVTFLAWYVVNNVTPFV